MSRCPICNEWYDTPPHQCLHECEGRLPNDGYGGAVNYCSEQEDGELWVGNGEYESQVAFCPYCGFEAKMKPEVERG